MGGGGCKMGVGNGGGVFACRDLPRNVCHVHEELGANRIRYLAEAREVDDPRVTARPRDDYPGFVFLSQPRHFIVIDTARFMVYAIVDRPVKSAGEVDRRAMSQVAPL